MQRSGDQQGQHDVAQIHLCDPAEFKGFDRLQRWLEPQVAGKCDADDDEFLGDQEPGIPDPFCHFDRVDRPDEKGGRLKRNLWQVVPSLKLLFGHVARSILTDGEWHSADPATNRIN